ncbi:MAG: hypothetical protein DMG35_20890 [Acidobacteria bacterium]|nr:MAG: hypothetical protein DMG35_20890 [Acidobacteriota bacterium]
MLLKLMAISAAMIALSLAGEVVSARTSIDACDLPEDLQKVLANKYSGTKIVRLSDLSSEDKEFFQKDHAGTCPGLVKVDFYGDGKPTFALELTTVSETYPSTKLVLAHKMEANWHVVMLDKAGGPIPVVWSEKPGEYKDIYGEKKILATRPVIIFCGYRSFTVVYAWMNNKVAKVWLRD